MPEHDWNDIKVLLAIHRAGRLRAAAQILRVDETTVARHLKRLEAALAAPLFLRDGGGVYVATEVGRDVIAHAEAIEAAHRALQARVGQISDDVAGLVRISAVPFVANHVLIPQLAALTRAHPHLRVDIVPEARNVDLSKREADLALRLVRPTTGGLALKAQRIGMLDFAAYTSAQTEGAAPRLWVGYDDASAALPQARWIAAQCQMADAAPSPVRVADLTTAIEAVAHGAGASLLPTCLRDARLRRLPPPEGAVQMSRPVWLLSHQGPAEQRSVRAVKAWLAGLSWQAGPPAAP